jgi:hypothetical protein
MVASSRQLLDGGITVFAPARAWAGGADIDAAAVGKC